LYLERESYRRRRLIDAQIILPIALFMLYLFPLLWGGSSQEDTPSAGARSFVHIFAIWGGAIFVAALLARALRRSEGALEQRDQGGDIDADKPSAFSGLEM
jgi:hypothetical protein